MNPSQTSQGDRLFPMEQDKAEPGVIPIRIKATKARIIIGNSASDPQRGCK